MNLFDEIAGARVLLPCSTGGHLAQMMTLTAGIPFEEEPLFVTFDTPQSRSLLADRQAVFVDYVAPGAYATIGRTVPQARSLVRRFRPEVVFSTGAGMALPYLAAAAVSGARAVYLESVSRVTGPSKTGRMAAAIPRVRTLSQHVWPNHPSWPLGPCVLENYVLDRDESRTLGAGTRAFVTLGTIQPFRFDRLIDAVRGVVPDNWEITWQLGCSTRADLPGSVISQMPVEDFDAHLRESDVVIAHGGVGTAMRALELGSVPVLVPRDPARFEHIDDHQRQIVRYLVDRKVCDWVETDTLCLDHLERAAGRHPVHQALAI